MESLKLKHLLEKWLTSVAMATYTITIEIYHHNHLTMPHVLTKAVFQSPLALSCWDLYRVESPGALAPW